MRQFFLFLLIVCFQFTFGQEFIVGKVLDANTGEPIEGATIYYDNTTRGVVTNPQGGFSIPFETNLNTPLIVSFLGYQSVTLYEYSPKKSYKILLEEAISTIREVVISTNNIWTRDYMLSEFKKNFLGSSKAGQHCVILNEEDILLSFENDENRLVASAYKPIIIKNNYLGYTITYQLHDFEVYYEKYKVSNKERYHTISSYYAGTSFFTAFKDLDRSIQRHREKLLEGSIMHFMRALFNNQLHENGYRIFKGSLEIDPKNPIYIKIEPLESNTELIKVSFPKPLNILYNRNRQSFVKQTEGVEFFYVNKYGNHMPPNALYFGGDMGLQRFGDSLPLDFLIEDQKQ